MQKSKFKKISVIALTIIMAGFSLPASSDGGFVPYDYPDAKDIYEPAQTALIKFDNNYEDIFLEVKYSGEAEKFAWIVPTPSYPEVEEAPKDLFNDLSIYTRKIKPQLLVDGGISETEAVKNTKEIGVIVHEQKQVGIYEIAVLSAKGSDSLYSWLKDNKYAITEEIKEVLDWYVKKEWYFVASKINLEELSYGIANKDMIDPLKISFKTNTIVYPLKISQISTKVPVTSDDKNRSNEILLYVLAKQEITTPEFITEYSDFISPEKINDIRQKSNSATFEDLMKVVDKEYFLTKIRRSMAKEEMDEDLYFINDTGKRKKPNIYFFWGERCSFCENEWEFLDELKENFDFNLYDYETWRTPENDAVLQLVTSKLDAVVNEFPFTVVGNEKFYGYLDSVGEKITQRLQYCQTYDCNDYVYDITEPLKKLTISYKNDERYNSVIISRGSAMADRLKGKIVIKVEDSGKAYYVNPTTKYIYYLGRPEDAFSVMREQGVGITNKNLEMIPIGASNLSGVDTDFDGLSDIFEDAIGTNKNLADTDGDGHSDKSELYSGYNPMGVGRLMSSLAFSQAQAGKIFIQVEGSGEAWYVNPEDSKRYFLGRPTDAFNVMRDIGLGISNDDFEKL